MKWTTILALLVVVAVVAEARLTPEERAQKRAGKQAAKAARRAKKQNKGERNPSGRLTWLPLGPGRGDLVVKHQTLHLKFPSSNLTVTV